MRGIGTDIAIVSCMVFLAQFVLSLLMGTIVAKTGEKINLEKKVNAFVEIKVTRVSIYNGWKT